MGKKNSGDRSPRAGSAAKKQKKKTGGKRRKPTPRQTNLIEGIVGGKTVRRAALDAGYSERMANHAGELLSSDALRAFCQQKLSIDKVLMRIDEGMDAEETEVIVVGRKGSESIKLQTYPNFSERRQSAALAARLIGADPAARIEVKGDLTQLIKVEFIHVAALQEP